MVPTWTPVEMKTDTALKLKTCSLIRGSENPLHTTAVVHRKTVGFDGGTCSVKFQIVEVKVLIPVVECFVTAVEDIDGLSTTVETFKTV